MKPPIIRLTILSFFLVTQATLSACGTTVGNPQNPITLQSKAYEAPTLAQKTWNFFSEFLFPIPSLTAQAAVSSFKFCVTQVKLKADDDSPVTQNGAESIEVALGLIDLSNATANAKWGQIAIPTGFKLKELAVELHHDSEKCGGASYSVRYVNSSGGGELTRDLEFKFEFNPAAQVDGGDTFTLDLANIVAALASAVDASAFNNEQISSYLQTSTIGSGSED